MSKIKNILAREIIDSRGIPAIECDIILDNNILGRSSIPSGTSKGSYEAIEIRDEDKSRFFGKGLLIAINNIQNIISKKLIGIDVYEQRKIDEILIKLDSTKNKSNLGANTLLAVSLACSKAAALSKNIFLFEYLGDNESIVLPVPMINIINGGSHADNNIDIQEFMICPINSNTFKESIQIACEIIHNLKLLLFKKGLNSNVGDEGGFAPNLDTSQQVIELILESIVKSGYKEGSDVLLSLDVASNELYKNNKYNLIGENNSFSSDNFCKYLQNLINNYPIFSIEDGMAEDDYEGWKNLTKTIGDKIQLVGDDLFVTNIERLKHGINNKIANSILIKLNQIGTLTETIDVIKYANKNNYKCIVSHRSGETEDTTISDLAVALKTGQIKTGSLTRSERTSKYNQLIRIEEYLGNRAIYPGKEFLNSKLK